jgi:hypothetical protein
MARRDETRAKGRERGRESTSANVKYVSIIALRARRGELTIGHVESKGTRVADEARRSVSEGKRL